MYVGSLKVQKRNFKCCATEKKIVEKWKHGDRCYNKEEIGGDIEFEDNIALRFQQTEPHSSDDS